MIELHNYRFMMNMCGGYKNDIWGLYGNVYNHPRFPPGDEVMVSTPVDLDEVNHRIITKSGSMYQLMNPAGNQEEIYKEIRQVIARGHYEYH